MERGEARVIIGGNCVKEYQRGDFFGEKALVENAPRAASIVAGATGAGVLRLSKDVFDAIKSRVANVLEERQDQYEESDFAGGR
jgi:CRP-like cAMP-binding protein